MGRPAYRGPAYRRGRVRGAAYRWSACGGDETARPRTGLPTPGGPRRVTRALLHHSKAIGGKSSAIRKYSKRYWITRIWLWRRWSLSSRCNAV